ncbi:MAG TPA: hypothetical protein VFB42_13580 [Gaiellaceae bacterium]|nr:hypothetical protein [Gaiellaceae bacterium]
MELERIAAAVAGHGAVAGVLAAEPPGGGRAYLVALGEGDERRWLAVDARARPLEDRAAVREVASLVALCEVAAELAGEEDAARVASPAYLDAVGTPGLASATGVVEAFVAEVLDRYRLPLR